MALNTAPFTFPAFISDVSVSIGTVRPELDEVTAQGVMWQAAEQRFLLELPEVARYLVESGRTVVIEPAQDASPATVERFLMMTPLAALMYQRGSIVLHGAVAVRDGRAIVLAGDSGSGKSTLLAELLRRGWFALSDDMAIIERDVQSGRFVVRPVSAEIRLWPDAVRRLEVDTGHVTSGRSSSVLMRTDRFLPESAEVHAIYSLSANNFNRLEFELLEAAARFMAIIPLAYNSHIADAQLDRAVCMRQVAEIAQGIPVYRLSRPRERWSVEELADRLAT